MTANLYYFPRRRLAAKSISISFISTIYTANCMPLIWLSGCKLELRTPERLQRFEILRLGYVCT